MKKYYLNRPTKKINFVVFCIPYYMMIVAFLCTLTLIPLAPRAVILLMLVPMVFLFAWIFVPPLFFFWTNYFIVDLEHEEIVLYTFRRKPRRIPISSIREIQRSHNYSQYNGAITSRRSTVYAVKNIEGYPLFYILGERVIFDLFRGFNIPIWDSIRED